MFMKYLAKTRSLGLTITFSALLALVLAAGCSSEPDPEMGPKVRELIQVIADQDKQVTEAVKNPLSKDDMKLVKSLLKDLRLDHPEAIKGDYALAVLDERGILIGVRFFMASPNDETDRPKRLGQDIKLNLGNFESVSQALKTGKHQQSVLYLPPDSNWGEKVYAVMSPVGTESDPAGVVVHFLRDTTLAAYGLDDQGFMALKFDN